MNTDDLLRMANELRQTVEKYESTLRRIRDQRGDDRCWRDFEELFALLPEGYKPPSRDTTVELDNCKRFIDSLRNPETAYVSPQREVEGLRKLISRMQPHLSESWYRGDSDGFYAMTGEMQTRYNEIFIEEQDKRWDIK